MAKLWPLPSSTVVSARRTVSAGMWITRMPSGRLIAPLSDSSLTSGRTLRFSRPGAITVGTKARLTPNCLNSMVTTLYALAATGMGNSPPARKLAVSPDCAVRFGSARMLMSWSAASASMMRVDVGLPVAPAGGDACWRD